MKKTMIAIAAVIAGLAVKAGAAELNGLKAEGVAALAEASAVPLPAAPERALNVPGAAVSAKISVTPVTENWNGTVLVKFTKNADIGAVIHMLDSVDLSPAKFSDNGDGYWVRVDIEDSKAPLRVSKLAGFSMVEAVQVNRAVYALLAGGSAMKTGALAVEYVAKEQGKFMTVQGLAFCTHDKTNYGYSFDLKETGYVNALFVWNKETGQIEKFDYKGWTDHGLLWDSRVFALSKANPDFPRVITLRNTRGGGNDVFHLSEYVDQDNYVIESKDPAFTVSSTAAYRNIFECTKR